MYFRNQNQAQILTIEDDFARLVDVLDNGDLEFEFTYSLQQSDVVKYNAQKVNINVEIRNISPKLMLATTHRGIIDTRGLVDNIRSAVSDAKSTLQTQQTYSIASRLSDITKVINPDVYPQLRARAANTEIPTFNNPRLALVPADSVKQSNDPQPILHRVALSAVVPDLQMAWRDARGGAGNVGRPGRRWSLHRDDRPVPAPHATAPSGGALVGARRVRRPSEARQGTGSFPRAGVAAHPIELPRPRGAQRRDTRVLADATLTLQSKQRAPR